MCARLEGDSSLVEEFELPLWLATTRNFGVAQCWRRRCSLLLLSTPLPGCGGVAFCCVSCVRCLCGGGVHFGV